MKAAGVFFNSHRNTCIRVEVGTKKTAYIPMDAAGLHVKRVNTLIFDADWSAADREISSAARLYLYSHAAAQYISEEARSLLQEIIDNGATTNKENEMSELDTRATTPAAVRPVTAPRPIAPPASVLGAVAAKAAAAKPAVAPPAPPAKAIAPKGKPAAKPAAKTAAKASTTKPTKPKEQEMKATTAKKAAPAKPTAKEKDAAKKAFFNTPVAGAKPAAKPAAKGGKAEKPAAKATAKPAAKPAAKGGKAEKPVRYAGMKIKVLNKNHGAREGTKRATAMDILIASKTTDEALKQFDKYEGIDTSFIRFAVENGIVSLS